MFSRRSKGKGDQKGTLGRKMTLENFTFFAMKCAHSRNEEKFLSATIN